ncbi:hypothetical protein GHT06_018849 [Daphnia sinensis]|uniref:Ionotropic glutamate receptor C-terminal domain-containing protein n=1 Tax=Daphnia sinensis TaxID=1820382 RepID=A0AAD5PUX8_9CRUS|nr:hypothetical protein GHT06_018849 [Daphnia sinensis]
MQVKNANRVPPIFVIIFTLFVSFTTPVTSRTDFGGVNLNFVVFHNPPFDFFKRGPNGTFTFDGVGLDVLGWMSTYFNFKFTLVAVNQTLVEKYGTHEASFYQLINDKEIDGISCAFFLTLDRIKRMDYTSSFVWVDGFSLVVPRPGEESRLFAFTRPFQPTVWLWIFIAMIFMVSGMTLLTWHHNRCALVNDKPDVNSEQHHKRIITNGQIMFNYFSSSMIYVVNTMTNQGCKEAFSRHSFRILVGCWLLGAMVLVNSYAGIVISSLTVPKMKPPIETLEDLASSEDVGLIIRHDVLMGEQILKATSGIYKILGDKVRPHPNQILGDPFKVNAMLETGKYAYPFVRAFNDWFVALQYKKDGHCRFHSTKPLSVPHGYYSWLVKKGNPNARILSKGLMNLWETGLVFFWGNRAIGVARAAECFDGKRQKSQAQQISIRLADLTSAFVILGIGLGLALLCFSLEHIKSIKKFDLLNCKQ